MTTRPRRDLNVQTNGDTTDIYLFGEIGLFGIQAVDFLAELRRIKTPLIRLHINSIGGAAYEGVAIYHALRDHSARVEVHVDGLCASAASVVAMAGDRIIMNRGTQFMIHDAWGETVGNADELAHAVEILDATCDAMAGFYAARAGGTPAEWRTRMKAETWYSAEEAVAVGLADEVGTAARVADSWEMTVFSRVRSLRAEVRRQVVVQLAANIAARAIVALGAFPRQ